MTEHSRPPRLAEWLLARFVPPGIAGRSILGDAREEYLAQLGSRPLLLARLWYWKHALSIIGRFVTGSPRQTRTTGRRPNSLITAVVALAYDAKIAFRGLRKRPGFTLAAISTLGLGIGANTVIFSVVDGMLFRPLPFPESHRLVNAFRVDPEVTGRNPDLSRLGGLYSVPYPVFLDWAEMGQPFEAAGAYRHTSLTMTGGDQAERYGGTAVSWGVLAALGARPAVGRLFGPEDDEVGAPRVVVLGHGTWLSRFGSEPGVIGQSISLNGVSHEIIGVMPRGFRFDGSSEDLWVTFTDEFKSSTVRNAGSLQVIARLKPGITLNRAQREMDAVARRIGELHPEEAEHGIGLIERRELVVANWRAGLIMLLGAVGLVLLIACANIANMLLVRATERQRELGLRQALGADRARLVAQHMSETVLLALIGGVVGCAVALVCLRPFVAAFPGGLPRAEEIAIDVRMLAFAAALALATGLVTGILPSVRAMRTSVMEVLQDGGRGSAGARRRSRTHAGLIVAEVAIAFVLLVGAGLFVRSLQRLMRVDTGIESANLIVSWISPPTRYRDWGDTTRGLYRDLTAQIEALPGIESFAFAGQMPFVGGWSSPPTVIETPDEVVETIVHRTCMTPGYLRTTGIPLLAGRDFTNQDSKDAPPVIVVNRAMADRFWPDLDPIGRRVMVPVPGDSVWRTVVGVAENTIYRLDMQPFSKYFVPFEQIPFWGEWLIVRSDLGVDALAPAIRRAVRSVDADIPVQVFRLDDAIDGSRAVEQPRFAIFIFGCLSSLAAILAVLGIYGVLSYVVQQQYNEIGIRMALGAEASTVVTTVLRRGLLMAGVGLVLGLGAALAASRVVRSLLFEVSPTDPITLAGVAVLILGATTLASWIPARRASRVDPVEALREQ
ncbi:MAG: ABC transporter permease [Gemmatimonadota bacterium]|nr:MAG: ABC transporter permease [Gemmatimonadota bacterium]